MAETPDTVDAQDLAEVFDEDNLDLDSRRLARNDEELNFDDMPDVYDATRADGDEDEEEALTSEDMDDEDLVELVLSEEDEGDEEDEDDFHNAAGVGDDEEEEASDEVGLSYAGDLSTAAGAHSAAQRYESRRLSDEDLEELGYADAVGEARGEDATEDAAAPRGAAGDRQGPTGLKGQSGARPVPETEPRSFEETGPGGPTEREATEARLDEAVEETFPASDPIAVKHVD